MTKISMPRGAMLALAALLATDMLVPPGPLLGPAPAQALVGRPATPVSVAGVARRTTRRTVVATTAVVAATPAPTTTVVVQAPPPAAAPAPAPATAPPPPK